MLNIEDINYLKDSYLTEFQYCKFNPQKKGCPITQRTTSLILYFVSEFYFTDSNESFFL
jgi:hypothetical protein